MLKTEKEGKEKLKRDMESYQQKFLKITSAPHKSQSEVCAKCPQLLITYVAH
jgi:hypothetical protein